MQNGVWRDFIALWAEYTKGVISPDIFKLWAAAAMVGAYTGRRVWFRTASRPSYLNLYVLLCGRPGVGKGVLDVARYVAKKVTDKKGCPIVSLSPDSMTRAALIDEITDARDHNLFCIVEEFEVLLPTYDREFIGTINKLWTAPDEFIESRRSRANKRKTIDKPILSLLAGATPSYFSSNFPEEAWTTGLARRIFLIYAAVRPDFELFSITNFDEKLEKHLIYQLSTIAHLSGEIKFSVEARELLVDWDRQKGPPTPTHSRLEQYNTSRTTLFLPRLASIAAIARSGALEVTLEDVERAKNWLIQAEEVMPDAFRDMRGHNSYQIIEELHRSAMAKLSRSGSTQQCISESWMFDFIAGRAPPERVRTIIDIALKGGWFQKVAGQDDLYRPLAKGLRVE